MAPLAQEVARPTPELKAAFGRGFEEILAARGGDRKEAIFKSAALIDGVVPARAVQNEQLSGDSQECSPESKLMIVNWRQQANALIERLRRLPGLVLENALAFTSVPAKSDFRQVRAKQAIGKANKTGDRSSEKQPPATVSATVHFRGDARTR